MSETVYNVGNSEDQKCSTCGSWECHWKNRSGKSWPAECVAVKCTNPTAGGAHVVDKKGLSYPSDTSDEESSKTHNVYVYIVPFCSTHNNQDNKTEIKIESGNEFSAEADTPKCKPCKKQKAQQES